MQKKKNYYWRFLLGAIVLIIATVVIFCITDGYAQLWALVPFCGIIPLGIWRLKLEEKQNNMPPNYNYRYRYPRK